MGPVSVGKGPSSQFSAGNPENGVVMGRKGLTEAVTWQLPLVCGSCQAQSMVVESRLTLLAHSLWLI
jgi:hypothetical protein